MPRPLHHSVELGHLATTVCAHCWDLMNLFVEDFDGDVPEIVVWPCLTAERTLDLTGDLHPGMVEGVTRAAHALAELAEEPADRITWNDLDSEDQDVLRAQGEHWLNAATIFATVRSDCCAQAYTCPASGERECLEHGGFDNCCDHPECPGNLDKEGEHEHVAR